MTASDRKHPGLLFKTPLRGALILCAMLMSSTSAAEDLVLNQGQWTLRMAPSGRLTSLAKLHGPEVIQAATEDGLLRLCTVPAGPASTQPARSPIVCDAPRRIKKDSDSIEFLYQPDPSLPVDVRYTVTLNSIKDFTVLVRKVRIEPSAAFNAANLQMTVGNPFVLPAAARRVFTPRQNGIGEELDPRHEHLWFWPLNGDIRWGTEPRKQLAIPMISEADGSGLRITHIADPFFATGWRVADPPSGRAGEINWVLTATRVALAQPHERTFWTVLHEGGPERAMDAWYATALADVPPGPDWLHEIAMQYFDYLSDGGKGWYEDIDALAQMVRREDRQKVVLTAHGWYDLIGRYTFNPATGKLDDEWTAFPRAPQVKAQFRQSESVRMSKAELHRRLRYAKDRGFRVCLYFADGLMSCDGAKDIYSPDQVLTWGGWEGPDSLGKTYVQNPAHPQVYKRFVDYLDALLAEYGDDIDALYFDETYYVRTGTVSGGERPAYACVAMMRLVRDLTQRVSRKYPNVAFMASDVIGLTQDGTNLWLNIPPYGIMSHGCYQDSHCQPETWPYGIFPNYRNVMWSCNWSPIRWLDYTRFGARHYRAPVALSNGWQDAKGTWQDGRGVAALNAQQRDAVMALFNERKQHRQQLKWLTGPAPVFGD